VTLVTLVHKDSQAAPEIRVSKVTQEALAAQDLPVLARRAIPVSLALQAALVIQALLEIQESLVTRAIQESPDQLALQEKPETQVLPG
jgi:hypothetical protein